MKDIYLVLYNIRSTHNVGSIFRTADAAGVRKIYLIGYTPEPFDVFGKPRKDFVKAALGAEKFVEWEKIKNIGALLKKLKKRKIFIASLEQSKNSIPFNRFASKYAPGNRVSKAGIALIIGNEVKGVPKSVLAKSDAVLEIPMLGKKESLNVSVAAGIALYALSDLSG